MPDLFYLLVACAYLAMAAIFFHRVMPAVRSRGRASVVGYWLLAFALGLFATGLLTDAPWLYRLAHVFLLAYAGKRAWALAHGCHERWGRAR